MMVLVKNAFSFSVIKYWLGITILLLCNLSFAFEIPRINTPVPNATFTDTSVRFIWNEDRQNVSGYWLIIGSTPEASDIFDSGLMQSDNNLLVGLLPRDGRKIYVRLWYKVRDKWDYTDTTYTTATLPAESPIGLISPAPHSVLFSTTTTFELYTAGEEIRSWDQFILTRTPETTNTMFSFQRDLGAVTTATVDDLPTDGNRLPFIYAHVDYTLANGETGRVTTRYKTPGQPYFIAPATGTTLSGSIIDVAWVNNGIDIEEYAISVGSTPEASDIFSKTGLPSSNNSIRIHDMPENGKMLFIRLSYKTNGDWHSVDGVYKAHRAINHRSPFIRCLLQCKENSPRFQHRYPFFYNHSDK